MRRPAGVLALTGIALLAGGGCDDGAPSATTAAAIVTVAPPTAVVVSGATAPTTLVPAAPTTDAGEATSSVAPSTTAAPPPSAPALDALLVPAADIPRPVTAVRATRPATLCGVPLSNLPIDARAVRWVDRSSGTAVVSWVEIHPGEAMGANAFAELATTLEACDWNDELPAQTRSTELAVRFVESPELLAGAPVCEHAVTGGVVRTTSDDGPLERREVLVVVVGCSDLVAAVRIDLLDQDPVDQQPWIGPLITAEIARVAAAT